MVAEIQLQRVLGPGSVGQGHNSSAYSNSGSKHQREDAGETSDSEGTEGTADLRDSVQEG